MAKFFYDCEFLEGKQKEKFPMSLFRKETKPTIDLISIGIVSDDERYYYAVSKEFNLKEAWNRYDEKECYGIGTCQNRDFHGNCTREEKCDTIKVYWIRDNVLKPIFRQWYGVHNNIDPTVFDHKFTYKEFKRLLLKEGKTNKEIAVEVKAFTNVIARDKFDNSYVTGEKVELYAYYGSYDHVALCWLFGKMIELPDGFPMYTNDLKQELDRKEAHIDYIVKTDYQLSILNKAGKTYNSIKEYPNYTKQYNAHNAHNALDDAIFNRNLYNFLKTL